MRTVLAWFTVRGASFLAAGVVGILAGVVLGSSPMISVGAMLICLPIFSALTARRARYQLRCERQILPPRVPPGQPTTVSIRLENISRISTGLLLAEETIPYSLGAKPRYVLNGIERGGTREVSYQLRSDLRGKFVIGPMRIRIADVFGLVELSANFLTQNTLTVTPRVVPLLTSSTTGSWSSDGDGRSRMTAAAGDDDVIPRAYRDGDELRRVHWRSTARYGELMVRREEQRWQDRAVVILDTRRSAHVGSGPSSSFEAAVSAAASVGVHLARAGLDGHLLTDSGPLAGSAMFEDVLLDALSVVAVSRNHDFARATAALSTIEGGLLVVIAGRLSVDTARELAAARKDGRQGIALLLDVATWASQANGAGQPYSGGQPSGAGQPNSAGQPNGARRYGASQIQSAELRPSNGQASPADGSGPDGTRGNGPAVDRAGSDSARSGSAMADSSVADRAVLDQAALEQAALEETAKELAAWEQAAQRGAPPKPPSSEAVAAEAVLRSAGWRVVTVDADTPLAVAWQRLPRSGNAPLHVGHLRTGAGA